jgi:DNA helicase-2/ATP-dependent DNA helicase PcrA
VNVEPAQNSGFSIPSGSGPRSRRAVADLVRRVVSARRGVSRIVVVEWVRQFVAGSDRSESAALVENVIDALCDLKDIGFGTTRGEPVLVALPERRVALPDGRVIALGDHRVESSAGSENLFPEVNEEATETLIDLLESFEDPVVLTGVPALSSKGRWTGQGEMAAALRRALTLSGVFDPSTLEWSTSAVNAAFLNEWFGLMDTVPSADTTSAPDASQLRVAKAAAGVRMVVEAGPGSGKTHAACERVISLVEDGGLAPSRILLLSFTRVAVAELRARITERLHNFPNVAALQIRTFDSFAARILAGSNAVFPGGYDASIRAAARLLRSGDPLVADAVGQLEHVIIDEAQDIVGDRKDLCEALVALLRSDCGITVFGDFAQSIYGYQQRDKSGSTFLSEVEQRGDFSCSGLEADHRTRTEALREMFRTVRETLRDDQSGSRENYFDVREQIRAAADENEITNFAAHPSTTRGLILTRSRRGLFTAAEAMRSAGRRFRLRLPDRPLRIEPWIGAVLGAHPASKRVSREAFGVMHEMLFPTAVRDVDESWEILLDLDGSGRDSIVVGRVAEGLSEPPLELLSDHEGNAGPLLSTIHAIKGREDQRVMLLLTRAPQGETVDWGEEARALYVGATRASTELRTGWINPVKFYTTGKPERYWTPRVDHRLIEVGLETDLVDWREFCHSGHVANATETIARIWQAAGEEIKVAAVPDLEGRLVLRVEPKEGASIGIFSQEFAEMVQTIRQVASDTAPPDLISGISVVGATTVVVPGDTGELPSLALMPLLGGFARIPR